MFFSRYREREINKVIPFVHFRLYNFQQRETTYNNRVKSTNNEWIDSLVGVVVCLLFNT